jgi:hypothetical protein
MSKFPQRPGCTALKPLVWEHLYHKISLDQKSFRCKQILYQKAINKDDNDPENCNRTYSVVQAPLQLTFYVANLITIK